MAQQHPTTGAEVMSESNDTVTPTEALAEWLHGRAIGHMTDEDGCDIGCAGHADDAAELLALTNSAQSASTQEENDRLRAEVTRQYNVGFKRGQAQSASTQEVERLRAAHIESERQLRAAWDRVALAETQVEQLRAALAEAREDVASWGAYASDYFQEKWDLAGDLARIDAALEARTPR